ncbi:MAG: FAD binding domain-containing protein [Ignavibacteria bacterium]|nr:FAD binding domain-containing protein [Ignavibacteria bacterium]
MISFILNNEIIKTDLPTGYVLLDYIRKNQRLTGTKEGCREGDCGACTVLIGELVDDEVVYKTVNSCLFPLGDVHLKHVVTIEGLNLETINYLQEQFVYQGGTQCGFCTPGFIVSSMGYLISCKNYNLNDALIYIGGNICRCTGYSGIRRALTNTINFLNEKLKGFNSGKNNSIKNLVELNFLPDYFITIPQKLRELKEHQIEEKVNYQKFVSGGTDLYVQRWEELVDKNVYLLSTKNDLKGIYVNNDEIFIGGANTISDVEESQVIKQYLPELSESLKYFGSKQIRNRATVAGNIVNASPIADLVNMLLVLDAKLYLESEQNKREIYLREFFKGYKLLDKSDDEIIKAISFKIPKENYLFNFEKISRRTYLDIASVNSSFFGYIENNFVEEIHISAGGVAPIPLYLKTTSSFLKNKIITKDLIAEAIEIGMNEISPISDARGSAEYKELLLRQLILAHFEKFFPELVSIDLVLKEV